MFVDLFGKAIDSNLVFTKRAKGFSVNIYWNKIAAKAVNPAEFNMIAEEIAAELSLAEQLQGKKTVSSITKLEDGYFFRDREDRAVELCGTRANDENVEVFRYVTTVKAPGDVCEDKEELEVVDAWEIFKKVVKEKTGLSLFKMWPGLPKELHSGRECVPSPINWCEPVFLKKKISGCTKADICSAYGTEASKSMPDTRPGHYLVKKGRIAASEKYPFAFYLVSGDMEVWGEGTHKSDKHLVEIKEEQTLLCERSPYCLKDAFTWLYDNRKDNPEYKYVMNISIGMFHRRNFSAGEDIWPLAAVVKFRCNKRINDLCDFLREKGQIPLLINTDSICWHGDNVECAMPKTAKKLGNFCLEYENCSLLYKGSKCYQVEHEDGVLTRWSGFRKKDYKTEFAFGDILDGALSKRIEDELKKAAFRWDYTKKRYVDQNGELFTI